jgi:hypothetical protein
VVVDSRFSGRFAYAFGQYYVREPEEAGGHLTVGLFVSVFAQRGGRWRLRALTFIRE